MATTPFPTIPMFPLGNQTAGPTTNSAGAIRWNTTSNGMEIYNGTVWVPATNKNPETWQEWFDYYTDAAGTIPDRYTKQVYIQQEMQGRFPGNYRVDLAGDKWAIVFDTPKDETWFNLKYS